MHCTIEKLQSLQQLYITLNHAPDASVTASTTTAPTIQPPFTPLLSVSNTYPYKPILQIRARRDRRKMEEEDEQEMKDAHNDNTPAVVDSYLIDLPLDVRVDLSDSRNHVTQTAHSTVLSLRIKQDLAEAEGADDFPTARELTSSEYPTLGCVACGHTIFHPRNNSSPYFTAHSLPSPYWRELTDLWFCHTIGNAHIEQLATKEIRVERGKILLDRLEIRVHADDVAQSEEAWKSHSSVRKVIETAAVASSSANTPSSPASANDPPRDIWSPFPCPHCHTIIGSIALTLSSANTTAPLTLSTTKEVRLWKYRLSNCFRKRMNLPGAVCASTSEEERKESDTAMTDASSSILDSLSSSSTSDPSSYCLCSSYAASTLLTCSNMYASYTFENFVCAELLQRYHKQPIGKFLLDNALDADDATSSEERLIVRLFVAQWNLPLASTNVDAFPFTPNLAAASSSASTPSFKEAAERTSSNRLVHTIKLDFDVHSSEEEPELQKWIHGKRKKTTAPPVSQQQHHHASCSHSHGDHSHACSSSSSSSASTSVPPSTLPSLPLPSNIDRISYSTRDLRTIIQLLQTRSRVWMSQSTVQTSGMRTSCLVKLTKNIK